MCKMSIGSLALVSIWKLTRKPRGGSPIIYFCTHTGYPSNSRFYANNKSWYSVKFHSHATGSMAIEKLSFEQWWYKIDNETQDIHQVPLYFRSINRTHGVIVDSSFQCRTFLSTIDFLLRPIIGLYCCYVNIYIYLDTYIECFWHQS